MSKNPLAHLATRIFNVPLLIQPRKMDVILRVLGPRLGLSGASFDDYDEEDAPDSPAYSVSNGIGVIPIYGILVKRSGGMQARSGMTSYEGLAEQIERAASDLAVRAILFDIDSPGGEAAGMSDLSDLIFSLRGHIPTIAVSNDSCYSAAYGIGSAADQVFVTSDGGVGSIGAYMLHCDQSGANEQAGLVYTYVFAGARKIDGNPMAPLSDAALAGLQNEVDRCRDMFVSLVARNRNVTPKQILDTQARCFYAEQGLPLLADRIGGLTDAMDDLLDNNVRSISARRKIKTL